MPYCPKCGKEYEEGTVFCPSCGNKVGGYSNDQFTASSDYPTSTSAPKVLGILSIVFGALGGWIGLVLGIIGLCIDRERRYRTYNIVGICLFLGWVLIYFIIIIVGVVNGAYA
ncbi:MAG: zinc-ribbon domain-containing protein [Bacillota bacterium]|nr:zinc-ribbon domain-containing protein [Bacillota bacterium]